MKNLSKIYTEFLKTSKVYKEVLRIVKLNNKNRHWLIGGFVYRNLINLLYGTTLKKDIDIDILIEDWPKKYKTIEGWKIQSNFYGNPKFVKSKQCLDLIPLKSLYHFKAQNLKPTVKNYLGCTRYSVESIVFDTKNKKIIGPIGIKSIFERKIAINNLSSAKLSSNNRKTPIKKLLSEKAKSLDFKVVKKI